MSSVESKKPVVLMMGQTPPPWHGQAVATKILFDHDWKKFTVKKLCMHFSHEMEEVGRIKVGKIGHLISLIRKARCILKDHPQSILFYPPGSANWPPFLRDFLFLFAVRHLAKKTVFIHHASGLAVFCNKGPIRRLMGRMAYGRSNMSLEVAEEQYSPHLHFKAKKHRWCPCGIDVPADITSKPEKRGPFRCLFVGSLQEGKGVLEILHTAKSLMNRGLAEQIRFQIVGRWFSDGFKNAAIRLQHELGISSMIDFSGELTGEQKWKAYSEADAFFFPTHYQSEATPIVLMEALGFGLPIITTKWAGIPKMLDGCNAAILLPIKSPDAYANAIQQLRDDSSLKDLPKKARSHYEKYFTPESFINRVESALLDSIS